MLRPSDAAPIASSQFANCDARVICAAAPKESGQIRRLYSSLILLLIPPLPPSPFPPIPAPSFDARVICAAAPKESGQI